jgi:hypothetical protein
VVPSTSHIAVSLSFRPCGIRREWKTKFQQQTPNSFPKYSSKSLVQNVLLGSDRSIAVSDYCDSTRVALSGPSAAVRCASRGVKPCQTSIRRRNQRLQRVASPYLTRGNWYQVRESLHSKAAVDERTSLSIIERSGKPLLVAACSRSSEYKQYARSGGRFGRNVTGCGSVRVLWPRGGGADRYQIKAKASIYLNPYVTCQTPG